MEGSSVLRFQTSKFFLPYMSKKKKKKYKGFNYLSHSPICFKICKYILCVRKF